MVRKFWLVIRPWVVRRIWLGIAHPSLVLWYVKQKFAEVRFRGVKRGTRDRCWCGSKLEPPELHANYSTCGECGSYVNCRPPLPSEIRRIYSYDFYWQMRQSWRGWPAIEDRAALYRADGRLDYWIQLIARYGTGSGQVVEIGCAPGVLLADLQNQGYSCCGVEPDPKVAQWIHEHTGAEVIAGVFPEIEIPRCDIFLAFDVLEHVHAPQEFLAAAFRSLRRGGIAIIQTPIEFEDYLRPFATRPEFFDDLEHLVLFTDRTIRRLASVVGLEVVAIMPAEFSLGGLCVLRRPDA